MGKETKEEIDYDIIIDVGEDYNSGHHYFCVIKVDKPDDMCNKYFKIVDIEASLIELASKRLNISAKEIHKLTSHITGRNKAGGLIPKKRLHMKFKVELIDAELVNPE